MEIDENFDLDLDVETVEDDLGAELGARLDGVTLDGVTLDGVTLDGVKVATQLSVPVVSSFKRGAMHLNQYHKLRREPHDIVYFVYETEKSEMSAIVDRIRNEHEFDIEAIKKNVFFRHLPETSSLIVVKSFQDTALCESLQMRFNAVLSLRAFVYLYEHRRDNFSWTKTRHLDSWVLQGQTLYVAGQLSAEEQAALESAGANFTTNAEDCNLLIVKDKTMEQLEWVEKYRGKIRYSDWILKLVDLLQNAETEDDIQTRLAAYTQLATISSLHVFICANVPNRTTNERKLKRLDATVNADITDMTKVVISPKTGLDKDFPRLAKIQRRARTGSLEVVSSEWIDESIERRVWADFNKYRVSLSVGKEFSTFSKLSYLCIRICTTKPKTTEAVSKWVRDRDATIHQSNDYRCDVAVFNPVVKREFWDSCNANFKRTPFCVQADPHVECPKHHLPLCEEELDTQRLAGRFFAISTFDHSEGSFLASVITHLGGNCGTERQAQRDFPNLELIRLEKNPSTEGVKSLEWFLNQIKLDKNESTASKRSRLDIPTVIPKDSQQELIESSEIGENAIPGIKPPAQDVDDFAADFLEGIAFALSRLGMVRSTIDFNDKIGVTETRKYSQCKYPTDLIQVGKLSLAQEHELGRIREIYLDRLLMCDHEDLPIEYLKSDSGWKIVVVGADKLVNLVTFVKKENWEWEVPRHTLDTIVTTFNGYFPCQLYKFPCIVIGDGCAEDSQVYYTDNDHSMTVVERTEIWLNKGAPRVYRPNEKLLYEYGTPIPNMEPDALRERIRITTRAKRYCERFSAIQDAWMPGLPAVGRVYCCDTHCNNIVFRELFRVEGRTVAGKCIACPADCPNEFLYIKN